VITGHGRVGRTSIESLKPPPGLGGSHHDGELALGGIRRLGLGSNLKHARRVSHSRAWRKRAAKRLSRQWADLSVEKQPQPVGMAERRGVADGF
jgi:hypothetical protein